MIKSLMAWNEEVKMYNKQIKKIEEDFAKERFYIVDTEENFKVKEEEYDKKEKLILAKYQQLLKLRENREKIREEIMKSNATNYIKVLGKEYTVALAIEKYRNADDLLKLLSYQMICMNNDKVNAEFKKENRIKELESKFYGNSRQPSESEKRIIEEAKELNKVKVVDPLNLLKKYEKMQQETEEFKSLINIVLNEHNVKTEIEINLD